MNSVDCRQMFCYSICFAILLIRFCYFVKVDDSIINRCIHNRTLEGDGEKPSRHENVDPLLILFFFLMLFYDGSTSDARITQTYKFQDI